MLTQEYNNVYLSATLNALRNVIAMSIKGKDLAVNLDDLSGQELLSVLLSGSQVSTVQEFARECKKINKKVFVSTDMIHAPGSKLAQCYKNLHAFCQYYKDFFVAKRSNVADVKPEEAETQPQV